MRRAIIICASCLLSAIPAFACQPCVVLEVSSAAGRAVQSPYGTPLPNAIAKLREARRRSEPDPAVLSCLGVYERGSVLKSVRTKRDGKFDFGPVKPGTYWLIIKGRTAQVVRLIDIVPQMESSKKGKPVEFTTSESGMVDNICDVLQAKDFM